MTTAVVSYRDFFELSKPRIVILALMMGTLGYALGTEHWNLQTFLGMLFGTGLVGAAACALNQHAELEIDGQMWRTMKRPLPSGRLLPHHALGFAIPAVILGELILVFFVNGLTAILGAFTVLLYMGIYTPSKKNTPLSTLVGAIPGALPPLMGWTAGAGKISPEGILLFAILFVWQIPHFLAIAWLYRDDYSRANLPILSVIDLEGLATSKQVVLYSVALVPLTLVPTLWGIAGGWYFFGSLLLGIAFNIFGGLLAWYRSRLFARLLFIFSILYLPALGILMVWDRIR